MARAYSGRDGQLLLAGTVLAKVTNWSLTADLELLETTSIGDAHRAYAPGIQSYNGSANILYYNKDDNTNDAGTLLRKLINTSASGVAEADTAELTLRIRNGNTNNDVKLAVYVTSATFGASVGEIVSAAISFQAVGAPSEVTI
jgi:hypothetical protein